MNGIVWTSLSRRELVQFWLWAFIVFILPGRLSDNVIDNADSQHRCSFGPDAAEPLGARLGSAPRRSRRTLECGIPSRTERRFSESLSHGARPGSAPRRASAKPPGDCLCTRAAALQRYRRDGPPASGADSRKPLREDAACAALSGLSRQAPAARCWQPPARPQAPSQDRHRRRPPPHTHTPPPPMGGGGQGPPAPRPMLHRSD